MSNEAPLEAAIKRVGLTRLAGELQISVQAVAKWRARRRMPRTEWTGETRYSETIERLTGGEITRAQLLAPWPDGHPVGA